jgi:hypothetical protein
LSTPEPSDAHARARSSAHAHSHPDHVHEDGETGDDADEPQSTGFLPLSLAVALFVTGLFVLGLIPGVQCG